MKNHKIIPFFILLMLPFLGLVFLPTGSVGEEKVQLQYRPWTEAANYTI